MPYQTERAFMAKLRKMLGDIESQECILLMRLIKTQSKETLAAWAVAYAKDNYLPVYEAECPGDRRLHDTIAACEEYLKGDKKLTEIKPSLKEAAELARDTADNPTAQALARAVSTACAAVSTPTNALGFLFYGAAAIAYSKEGLMQPAEVYDAAASLELNRAYESLKEAAVPDEQHPAKIKWYC